MSDQKRGILTIISGFQGQAKELLFTDFLRSTLRNINCPFLQRHAVREMVSSTVYIIFSRVMKSSDR